MESEEITLNPKRNQKLNKTVILNEEFNRWKFILFIVGASACVIVLILAIALAALLNDGPSIYKNFLDAINQGGFIQTNIQFDKNINYVIPSNIGNNGRAFITISGAGGGGCFGNFTYNGGGGNSGASGVNVPILLHSGDTCSIIVGIGGNSNTDGTFSEFKCISSGGGLPTVDFLLLGGRSGCYQNYNNSDRLGDNNFPFISERFGSRPIYSTFAESNIYGGIGGSGLGGGAGSIFANGGNAGTQNTVGQNGGFGAGGGGGGTSSIVSNIISGGKGGNGFIQLNYAVNVKS